MKLSHPEHLRMRDNHKQIRKLEFNWTKPQSKEGEVVESGKEADAGNTLEEALLKQGRALRKEVPQPGLRANIINRQ